MNLCVCVFSSAYLHSCRAKDNGDDPLAGGLSISNQHLAFEALAADLGASALVAR